LARALALYPFSLKTWTLAAFIFGRMRI
jgi:hypothetical protein